MKKLDFGQDLEGVGLRMRQVRELNGLSQGRMSRLIGIENQSTYGNYEAGRSVPLDFVIHYHNVCNERLGVRFTLDWLLRGVGDGPRSREDGRSGQGATPSVVNGPALTEPAVQAIPAEPAPAQAVPAQSAAPGFATGGASAANADAAPPDIAPPTPGEIDARITEHIARSTEVLRELLRRKFDSRRPEDLPVHPFLREIPFAVIDMMSVVRYASPSVCRLLKTTPEAVMGQSSMRFGKMAFDDVVPDQIQATLTRGYWIGEATVNTSRFEPLPVVMIMWLMRDEDRAPCMGIILLPKSDVDGLLEELKGLEYEAVKNHVAWEHSIAPDKPKPGLPE